jgi:flagellar biosynthetic protein FlhB
MSAEERSFLEQLDAMHLQWFAAEEEGRTEDPTEHKIQEAREEGKVAKSQDVNGAVILLFTVAAIGLMSGYLLNTFTEMISFFFSRSAQIDVTSNNTVSQAFFSYFVQLTWPIGVVALVSAILANLVQVGPLFTLKPLKPDPSKIVPRFGKFVQRSLLSVEALFNFFKNIGKVLILGALAYFNIAGEFPRLANLVRTPFYQSFGAIAEIAFRILIEAAIIMLVLSIFDYMFQRYQHRESLKMTKQEVKEERKTYEGDPQIKNRLQERMQEMLSKNQMQNVPNADVVVTNPTHFAVAMEYRRFRMNAPTVIAKGQDHLAQRMRELAQESDVPIIENRPLARALYQEVEIGQEIPEKFYEAVVTVLKQVYRMTGRSMEAG